MKDFSVDGYWYLPSAGERIAPSFTLSKVSFFTGFRRAGIYPRSTFVNCSAAHFFSELNLEEKRQLLCAEYRIPLKIIGRN